MNTLTIDPKRLAETRKRIRSGRHEPMVVQDSLADREFRRAA